MEGGFRLGAGGGSGGSTGGCGHGSWLTLSKGRTCSLLVGLPTAEGAESFSASPSGAPSVEG